MILETTETRIGLLLSGGLDSSILLGSLLAAGYRVRPFYVRSGLYWESAELAAARRYLAAVDAPNLEQLIEFELPLGDLYGEHWSTTGERVPDATTPDEAVYLPGRNALLAIKPALWCHLHGITKLALAPLESNPFPDATAGFFRSFATALDQAVGSHVEIIRPFAQLDKRSVMRLGADAPLELTFSCIAPVAGRRHCGLCNKCAERQAAFQLVGRQDPTDYARSAVVRAPHE